MPDSRQWTAGFLLILAHVVLTVLAVIFLFRGGLDWLGVVVGVMALVKGLATLCRFFAIDVWWL